MFNVSWTSICLQFSFCRRSRDLTSGFQTSFLGLTVQDHQPLDDFQYNIYFQISHSVPLYLYDAFQQSDSSPLDKFCCTGLVVAEISALITTSFLTQFRSVSMQVFTVKSQSAQQRAWIILCCGHVQLETQWPSDHSSVILLLGSVPGHICSWCAFFCMGTKIRQVCFTSAQTLAFKLVNGQ